MVAVPGPKWILVEGLGKTESAATLCGLVFTIMQSGLGGT